LEAEEIFARFFFNGVFELELPLSRSAQKRDKKKEEKKAVFFVIVMSRDGLFRFFFPCF
jgi:hypothetical protein